MFPKLKKFLTKPARTRTKAETVSNEPPAGRQSLADQASSLLFHDPYRGRKSSADESLVNQELHFIVDYLGYCQVSEVQSISLLLESVKRVKKGCSKPTRIDFVIKEGVLKISSTECHSLILTVPLYIVALCAQESLRGFDKCFGVNITRKNAHLCYVFQAGSSLEASSIVRSVALSFKSLGKMLREKKEKLRQSRRRKKPQLYHQNSVGSDWSSQSGYYNESSIDPWQQFETWSRVSSTTSKGSEQQRQSNATRQTYNTPTAKRSSTYHSFKHAEFTALSPVPSNNSSNENSVENLHVKTDSRCTNLKGSKRKGEFKVEVDVHQELNQKLGRVEKPDDIIVPETCESPKEELLNGHFDDQPLCFCWKNPVLDERIELVLSAIQRGDLVCLASYLDDGVEVDLADSTRRSLLFHAVNYGHIGAVQLLLDRGANVNWEGPNDMSPLHQAAANRDKSIAQILLANGANVRAKDCDFRTPLHMCAGHPSGTEMSCILVEHGARICDNSIDGTRPLDLLPDLKELQSRLVQSVCEAFMAADTSKSHSNSITSTQSYQSSYSMMSGGSVIAHLGSFRNLHNQSSQMRHARHASRRFAANFDLGSFQWKKDTRFMVDDNPIENAIRKHDRSCRPSEDVVAHKTTCQDNVAEGISSNREDTDKKANRKPSFRQESCAVFARDPANRVRKSSTVSSPVHLPSSFAETGLAENILAEHQSGSIVVGSVGTWTKGVGDDMLLSSTPADAVLCADARHVFSGDVAHHLPEVVDSTDSGLPGQAKEDHSTAGLLNQTILHNSRMCCETVRGRGRGDSVRFQDSAGPTRETDSGLGYPDGHATFVAEAKDLFGKCRERTRSNADSCYSSISPYAKEDDPVLLALSSLVKLSFNPECQPLLLSYLCLPKASSQLSVFARSPTCSQWVSEAVAVLIKNLANIEGPDSRRRAAEAGFIRTVLELAEAHEPVQTTCLEVLDNLLKDVKCEREYNSTMSNIPSGPLLNLLHYQNDAESGARDTLPEAFDAAVNGRKNILCSHSRCGQDSPAKLSPRLVATRLLAASSTHLKMQRELGTSRAVSLLLEALQESDEEIVYNAVVTLANIAMHYDNHELLLNSAAVEKLKSLVPKNSRTYYHVCRALVYLDQGDDQCDYLFDFEDQEPQPLYAEQCPNQEPFIKGGSLETLVRILTTRTMMLWGGVTLLLTSPKSRSRLKSSKRKMKISEEHVIEFFLATYSTYTDAVVLMRLLRHRFHDPSLKPLFDQETGVFTDDSDCLPQLHMVLMRIWEIWLDKFPEDFRENSLLQLQLNHLINTLAGYGGPYLVCADRLEELFTHYQEETSFSLPPEEHCHHDVLFRSCHQAVLSGSLPARLDDAVYLAALQLYVEMSSLGEESTTNKVFYSDNVSEKISTSRIKLCLNPAFHKVKNVFKRVRSYYEQIAGEAPSQRKAKHDYIDCCQGMAGYGCKFFRVKEVSCCNKSHLSKRLIGVGQKEVVVLDGKTRNVVKKWNLKSLLGWKTEETNGSLHLLFSESSFQLVCDNKAGRDRLQQTIRQCVYERNCEGLSERDFVPWSKRSEEQRNWGRKAMEEDMKRRLENLSRTTRIFENQDEWKSLSLLYVKSESKEPRFRRHSSPTSKNPRKGHPEIVSTGQAAYALTTDDEDLSNEDDVYAPMMAYSVGTLEERRLDASTLSRSQAVSMQKSSIATRSTVARESAYSAESTSSYPNHVSSSQTLGELIGDDDVMTSSTMKICLCPPDAELLGFNRNHFTPIQLLQFPRELARQITLIDHELFRSITTADILKRVSEGASKRRKKGEENWDKTTVKVFSDRFNQLSSWVVSSLLKEDSEQNIADMIVQFIETAKQCLELRNYNAVMAIGVGALCSAPVRRLRKARDLIPKWYMDQLHIMEVLMDSRENHKKYRESLKVCPSPAVPYFGVYLKDLIYISEGNPDYLNGGKINLGKRRLLYAVLYQIRRFQVKSYNFEQVAEIQDYLLNTERYSDEELHRMSRKLDNSSRHTISDASREVSMSVSAVSLA